MTKDKLTIYYTASAVIEIMLISINRRVMKKTTTVLPQCFFPCLLATFCLNENLNKGKDVCNKPKLEGPRLVRR